MLKRGTRSAWGAPAVATGDWAASRKAAPAVSARLLDIGLRFGVPVVIPEPAKPTKWLLHLGPGTLTLITGPSGSGKSQMLAAIAQQFPAARWIQNTPFPSDVAVVDGVAPTRPLQQALGILTACGLGEPMLWIRPFTQFSEGERFRARLARAISLSSSVHHANDEVLGPDPDLDDAGENENSGVRHHGPTAPLLCDEFGALLHTRLAKATAFNLRKLVSRERLALVVATSRQDLHEDLSPDTTVRLGGCEPRIEHARNNESRREPSFARQLRIQRGTLAEYVALSSMHYRCRGQVGFVDKVFVCREGSDGPLLGVVVYAHPALELKLRNDATQQRFSKDPRQLNRELRLLKRLIIHPDIRGCGIGHWLVRRTLPMVGTRFVECLSAMGAVNPVFEKAGMQRIGVCEAPASRNVALDQLRAAGADPLGADFTSQVCRRPAVRRIVARCVLNWYRGISANSDQKVASQTPTDLARTFRQLIGSQPVYYLWAADEAGWDLIRRNTEPSYGAAGTGTRAPAPAPHLPSRRRGRMSN